MGSRALLILALSFARVEAQEADADVSPAPSQIRTSATATRSTRPDLAIATFEFSSRGRTMGEASRAAGATRNAIRRALARVGVPDDSILTPDFDTRREENVTIEVKPVPEFRAYDTTYVFRDRLVARIRNLDRLGSAIDTAFAAGAQRITALQFSTSRGEQLRQEALQEASRRVRASAELMAQAAGGKLGRLLDLSTDGGRYDDVVAQTRGMSLAVSSGIQAGATIKPIHIDTQVSVYGRWEFVPNPATRSGP
jgi:uncharacterized protein YggE